MNSTHLPKAQHSYSRHQKQPQPLIINLKGKSRFIHSWPLEERCTYLCGKKKKKIVKHLTDEEGNFRSEDYFLRKGLDRNDLFIVHEIYLKLPITWKNRRQDDIQMTLLVQILGLR